MAAMTIRNLEDETKNALRLRGARRGTSMEDEARSILRAVVRAGLSLEQLSSATGDAKPVSAWDSIRELRETFGAFDLEMPERLDRVGERVDFA